MMLAKMLHHGLNIGTDLHSRALPLKSIVISIQSMQRCWIVNVRVMHLLGQNKFFTNIVLRQAYSADFIPGKQRDIGSDKQAAAQPDSGRSINSA